MARAGEIERSPEQTREDFDTDRRPSLFIDNWGEDVMERFGDKVKAPIDAAVALAQLISSIRSGEPINPKVLDPEVLDGLAFVDGTDEGIDHFFGIELEPLYRGGSYAEPRVAASFVTGYVELEPRGEDESSYAHYDERWTTRRGDVISGRSERLFEEDARRINNVLSVLGNASEADLATRRPATWTDSPSDIQPSRTALTELSVAKTPIYVGESPLAGVGTEADRKVHIAALDGPGPIGAGNLPNPSNMAEALVLFAAVDAEHQG